MSKAMAPVGPLSAQPARSILQWGALLVGLCGIALVYVLPLSWSLAIVALTLTTAFTLRYPVAGICLIAITVPWGSVVAPSTSSIPLTPTDLIAAELSVAWILSAVVARKNPIGGSVLAPYIALYLGAVLLSVTQSADIKASAPEVIKWTEFAAVYFASVWFTRTRKQLRLIAWALVAGGLSEAFLGYYQFALQAGPAAFGLHRAFFRSYGTFDQPNPYAGYLNMVLPLAVALGVTSPSRWERWCFRAAATVIGLAVVASQSRGALLAGFVALLAVTAFLFTRIRPFVGVAGLGVICVALGATVGVVPSGPITRVLTAVGLGDVSFGNVTDANFSAVERAAHWLAGVRMFAAHPLLGVGIGNYSQAYPMFHPRGWYASLEHAHNYYINIAAEAGIAGLTAYTLLIGCTLWYIYAILRVVRDPLCVGVVLGVLGALIATSLHNVFDVLYVHGMATLLGCILALASAGRHADWVCRHSWPMRNGQSTH